jgi:hypothetical protein
MQHIERQFGHMLWVATGVGRKSGVKPSVECPLLSLSTGTDGCRYGCRGLGYGELERDRVTRMTRPCPRCEIVGGGAGGDTTSTKWINKYSGQMYSDSGDESVGRKTGYELSDDRFSPLTSEFGSPHIFLGGGDRDPFASFPVPTVRYMEIPLRHCKSKRVLTEPFLLSNSPCRRPMLMFR